MLFCVFFASLFHSRSCHVIFNLRSSELRLWAQFFSRNNSRNFLPSYVHRYQCIFKHSLLIKWIAIMRLSVYRNRYIERSNSSYDCFILYILRRELFHLFLTYKDTWHFAAKHPHMLQTLARPCLCSALLAFLRSYH